MRVTIAFMVKSDAVRRQRNPMNNIDISQFSRLKKRSSDSFHQQKKMITQLLRGEEVKCEHCHQAIVMIPASNEHPLKLRCVKECTDIELDIAL